MLKIEELSRKHNRAQFDCGAPALNQYLKKTARQHIVKGISKTFVLVSDTAPTEILGFFTLAFCEVQANDLPTKWAKKYPKQVPAAKLARLAISQKRQRQGLGSLMMINAIERTILVSQNVGIIGFFVDAKDEKAKAYYDQFGFISLPDHPLTLFIPLKNLEKAYQTIKGN